jgi:hypothetical protein
MSQGKRSSRLPAVLLLVALAGGVVCGLWMATVKAHDYYYPGRLHLLIREPVSTFRVEQAGRHELSYRDELGDLKFDVVSVDQGRTIPVDRFSVLSQAFHTAGRCGHAVRIDSPGVYRLSTRPWPNGAEVELAYTNTEAIARWALGGILLAGGCIALMILLAIGLLARPREVDGRPTDVPRASSGNKPLQRARDSDKERRSHLVADLFRGCIRAMIAGSLAFFAVSLFLPFAYGAEIAGVMAGLAFLQVSFLFGWSSPLSLFMGVAYLAPLISLLAARLSPRLAASLVAFGLLLPIWTLAAEGLYINAFLSNRRILNTGCVCLLVADLLMLAAWIATGLVAGAKPKACPGPARE